MKIINKWDENYGGHVNDWLKVGEWKHWMRDDEQLMDSIRMEFIILFEGTSYNLDFAFSSFTLNVLNKILNFFFWRMFEFKLAPFYYANFMFIHEQSYGIIHYW